MNIQNKFDERSIPGIFVGYPFGQKGYDIYVIQTNQIYVSCDVVFHKNIFHIKIFYHLLLKMQ